MYRNSIVGYKEKFFFLSQLRKESKEYAFDPSEAHSLTITIFNNCSRVRVFLADKDNKTRTFFHSSRGTFDGKSKQEEQ